MAAASLLLCSFLKCFFGLVSVIFLQYIANVTHRTFEIVQKKSRSCEYKNYLIISVIKNVERANVNVHSSCPQFWGLHTEERKQCYEYIIHDNYSVGLDKNTNDFMQ